MNIGTMSRSVLVIRSSSIVLISRDMTMWRRGWGIKSKLDRIAWASRRQGFVTLDDEKKTVSICKSTFRGNLLIGFAKFLIITGKGTVKSNATGTTSNKYLQIGYKPTAIILWILLKMWCGIVNYLPTHIIGHYSPLISISSSQRVYG